MGNGDVKLDAAPTPVGFTPVLARIEASPDQHATTLEQKVMYRVVLETSAPMQLISLDGRGTGGKTPRQMFDETGRTTVNFTPNLWQGSAEPLWSLQPGMVMEWYVLFDKNGDGTADAYDHVSDDLKNAKDVTVHWRTEGQHVVLCYVAGITQEINLKQVSIAKLAETQLLFRQWVGRWSSMQFRQFRDVKSKGAPDPFSEYQSFRKYLDVIRAAQQYRDAPEHKRQAYREQVDEYEDYLSALRRLMPEIVRTSNLPDQKTLEFAKRHKLPLGELIMLTSGLGHVLPVASYVSKDTSEHRPLRLCLFYRWELGGKLDVLHVSLVDWTNPEDERLSGRYDASNVSPYDAVQAVLNKWRDDNQYYHPGNVKWEIPRIPTPPGVPQGMRNGPWSGQFDTRKNVWDKIKDFLDSAALWLAAAAAVLAFVVPIPGAQIAAPLMWEALFAGAAASVISIARRRDVGFADWREDARDLLGIAGPIFRVGKVAGTIVWKRGATLASRQFGGTFTRYMTYGEWASDRLEALLIADQFIDQFNQLMTASDLDPKERVDKLLDFLKVTAVSKGTSYVNVLGARRLVRANTRIQANERIQTHLESSMLTQLADPTATIDLDKLHKQRRTQAASTGDKRSKTTVQDEPRRTVNPGDGGGGKGGGGDSGGGGGGGGRKRMSSQTFAEKFGPIQDSDIWRKQPLISPTHVLLLRKLPGHEDDPNLDLIFEAELKKGEIHVKMIRTYIEFVGGQKVRAPEMRADELLPMIFDHFEDTARRINVRNRRINGEWALDNYADVKKALETEPGMPLGEAIKRARAWKYVQQYLDHYGYDLKPSPQRPKVKEEGETYTWGFDLVKKTRQ